VDPSKGNFEKEANAAKADLAAAIEALEASPSSTHLQSLISNHGKEVHLMSPI